MSLTEEITIEAEGFRKEKKENSSQAIEKADSSGVAHGFIDRPVRRGGRPASPPSPRTAQMHTKLLPRVARKIAAEARQRGVQQGVLIEEAWVLYERENKPACEAATTC